MELGFLALLRWREGELVEKAEQILRSVRKQDGYASSDSPPDSPLGPQDRDARAQPQPEPLVRQTCWTAP